MFPIRRLDPCWPSLPFQFECAEVFVQSKTHRLVESVKSIEADRLNNLESIFSLFILIDHSSLCKSPNICLLFLQINRSESSLIGSPAAEVHHLPQRLLRPLGFLAAPPIAHGGRHPHMLTLACCCSDLIA